MTMACCLSPLSYNFPLLVAWKVAHEGVAALNAVSPLLGFISLAVSTKVCSAGVSISCLRASPQACSYPQVTAVGWP